MVDRNSTATAPWTLVESNNKYHARIKVLKTLCEAVEQALERQGQPRGKKRDKKP
jgi:polyphosphate kinase 2 (PPK2 family)